MPRLTAIPFIVLSTVLRIGRALDSTEIDRILSDVQARKALAAELSRRREWQRVVENAARFEVSGVVELA